ncbi:hypothetical protein AMTRI_Chr08g207390 [Amborella trichopoda]
MQGSEQSDTQLVIDVVNGNVRLDPEEGEIHKGAFTPRLVSLGPFDHGSPHLQLMERHKRRVEQKLRACYEWPDELPGMESPKFLNMMLLDGCFLLELHRTTMDEDTSGYADDDPVFGPKRADFTDNIGYDLAPLENQIPLLVLQTLLDPLGERSYAAAEAQKVAHELHFNDKYTSMRDRSGMHPLHICQMLSQSPWGKLPEVEEGLRNPEPYHKKVPSATALHDAGVKFQVIPSDSNMGIGFDGGVLKLPCLVITPATETFLLNVMPFEQLHVDMDNPFISFVNLMDNLIDEAKDVQRLVDSGIIENRMESDQEVAELFNRVTKGMAFFENSHLKGVRMADLARFVNTYLRDPWAVIALLAAVLLLCLTLIQTVYSVLSYIK